METFKTLYSEELGNLSSYYGITISMRDLVSFTADKTNC